MAKEVDGFLTRTLLYDEMKPSLLNQQKRDRSQCLSPTAALAQVLPTSTFLENIFMSTGSKRRRGHVNKRNLELEVEHEMEKERSEALKQGIEGHEQVEKSNNCRMKQVDEIEHIKKAQEDMDQFFHRLFEKQG